VESKAYLESILKVEICATHTHVLLSASVSKGLKSYAGGNKWQTKSILALACPEGSVPNLQANLQWFDLACKEQEKQMMDFIACLQQLCLQASTTASPIGDNTFI